MKLYEVYDDAVCPRRGCTDARDAGPYDPDPWSDDALGGPPDPCVHLMWCLGCGKPFDVAPDWHVERVIASWPQDQRERVQAEGAITDAIRELADGTWDGRCPDGAS